MFSTTTTTKMTAMYGIMLLARNEAFPFLLCYLFQAHHNENVFSLFYIFFHLLKWTRSFILFAISRMFTFLSCLPQLFYMFLIKLFPCSLPLCIHNLKTFEFHVKLIKTRQKLSSMFLNGIFDKYLKRFWRDKCCCAPFAMMRKFHTFKKGNFFNSLSLYFVCVCV